MRADNSRHLIAAARDRAEQTHTRALRAPTTPRRHTGIPVTFETVAREAGASRSWLYNQADLRAEIQALRARSRPSSSPPPTPQRQAAADASLLRRLEAATERLRQLKEGNRQLSEALAEALGATPTARVTGQSSRRDTPGRQARELIGPC